jgi:hypothetical protein
MGGHVARIGQWRGVNRVPVEKPEEKSQIDTKRRTREDNIKMNLREVRCGACDLHRSTSG